MRRTALLVVSIAVLVLVGALAVLRYDEETGAYRAGAALGAVALALVIGLVIRFLYVRFVARGEPVGSVWVLPIAAAVGLVLSLGAAGREAKGTEDARASCDEPARTAQRVLGPVPRGWDRAPADPALLDEALAQGGDAIAKSVVKRTGVTARRGEEAVVVIALEAREPVGDDLLSGFDDAARGPVETVTLGDREGRLQETPDGGASAIAPSDACSFVLLLGTSPRALRAIVPSVR